MNSLFHRQLVSQSNNQSLRGQRVIALVFIGTVNFVLDNISDLAKFRFLLQTTITHYGCLFYDRSVDFSRPESLNNKLADSTQ